MDFYKGHTDYMEFASDAISNPFGAELLRICENRFNSLPEAVDEVTAGLQELNFNVDKQGVIGLLTGEVAPSEDLTEALLGLAPNEVDATRLANGADQINEIFDAIESGEIEPDEAGEYDIEDLGEFEEGVDDEDIEDDEDDEDEGVEGEDGVTDDELEGVKNESKDLTEALYARQIVEDRLNNFSARADQMMATGEGLMTPYIKAMLFGSDANKHNQYVNFSKATDKLNYTADEYLKCIEFSLGVLKELGSVDSQYFKAAVKEEVADDSEISFSKRTGSTVSAGDLEASARETIDLLNL